MRVCYWIIFLARKGSNKTFFKRKRKYKVINIRALSYITLQLSLLYDSRNNFLRSVPSRIPFDHSLNDISLIVFYINHRASLRELNCRNERKLRFTIICFDLTRKYGFQPTWILIAALVCISNYYTNDGRDEFSALAILYSLRRYNKQG